MTTFEGENFGLSVFLREGDSVFHTYFTTARGVEVLASNAAASTMTGVSSVLGSRVDVAVLVRLLGADENDVWHQIHEQPGVELDVGMDGVDREFSVPEKLREPQALRSGEGKVDFSAMPNSNNVRCSGRLMIEMIRCRLWIFPGSTPANERERNQPVSGCPLR